MQGPAVDIVLLVLLILFFGMQQRRRPELFFRFWFAGWVLVSFSVMVGAVPLAASDALSWHDAMRANRMLLGGMAFLLSFIATREKLRKMVLVGLTFGVPALAVVDADILVRPPSWLLGSLLLAGQAAAVHAVYVLLPAEWRWRRRAILAICVSFGFAMLLLPGDTRLSLPNLMMAEVFLSAAVLYGGSYARRSFAGFAGALGFFAWGAFYIVVLGLPQHSGTTRVFYEFWSVPKYFVGLAMILQIFEDSRLDFERLAKVYRTLYEDFRLMYQNHPHPMWIYDDATNCLLSVNVAATTSYGFTEQELLQMRMSDLEAPDDTELDTTNMLILQPADGRRARHRRKDGSVAWVNVVDSGILFQGKEARLVIARDVTRQLDMNRELAHRAHHDALTGLPNRVLLEDRIRQCFERCSKDERKAVLLTIDVDHFKRINDTYGHQVGDECLKAVALRLKSKIRQVDTIARAGGEEFVAIVGGLRKVADASRVTDSLLGMFETPLRLSCGVIPVTVSIGGAIFPDDGLDVEDLQIKSDQALYAAKRAGRNRVVFASAEVDLSFTISQHSLTAERELAGSHR